MQRSETFRVLFNGEGYIVRIQGTRVVVSDAYGGRLAGVWCEGGGFVDYPRSDAIKPQVLDLADKRLRGILRWAPQPLNRERAHEALEVLARRRAVGAQTFASWSGEE